MTPPPNPWQQNIQAFGAIYPSAVKALEEAGSVQAPSMETAAPHSPPDIEFDEQAHLHVACRFAASGLAWQLMECIHQAEILAPCNRRLLLIEDRLDAMALAFAQRDWRTLIQSERCLWYINAKGLTEVRYLLSRYPQIAHPRVALYWGQSGADPEASRQLLNELCELWGHFHRNLDGRLQPFVDNQAGSQPPPYPRRVRYFVPGHNAIQEAMVKNTGELGYECLRLQWKTPLYRFIRDRAWIAAVEQENIDAAVFLNATPQTFCQNDMLERLPIRCVAWFVDNPRRYVWDAQQLQGCDAVGVFDRAYLPYLRQLSDRPVIEARTAFGVDPTRAVPDPAWSQFDVAFVGELGVHGFAHHQALLHARHPQLLDEIDAWLAAQDWTQHIDIAASIMPLFEQASVPFQAGWVEYVENKATALRRRYLLEALHGTGLHIFGDAEWADPTYAGPLADHYQGRRIDYAAELPRLYASAKIHVNIFHAQCTQSPNPRVYDVLACGGFMLSMDSPGLRDELTPGEDLAVFQTRGELREAVEYYLAHPEERRAIAECGRLRTLAKCRYSDRIQKLFATLSQIDRTQTRPQMG